MSLKNLNVFASTFIKSPAGRFLAVLRQDFPAVEVYFVGGSVRDALLGRAIKDVDLVVRNVPAKKLEKLLQSCGSVNLVGKKFGVYKFVPAQSKDSRAIDVALPRLEFSIGNTGHYRDFEIQSDHRLPLDQDLARRDFTVNAMAYDVFEKKLIDPWNGCADLEAKTIRAVGDPHTRFAEDYSRMLRAIRFACQLDFSIHAHTKRAIKELMPEINSEVALSVAPKTTEIMRAVPYEIISREIIKALVARPVPAFDLLNDFGVFSEMMPELNAMKKCPQPKEWHSEGDVWAHTRLSLAALNSKRFVKEFGSADSSALLVMATLMHDIGKPPALKTPKRDKVDRIRFDGHDRIGADMARSLCERLRTSSVEDYNVDPDAIHWLVKNHLLLLNSDLAKMKNNTIEKYFFRDRMLGTTLLKLTVADGLGSIRRDGKVGLDRYTQFKRRLKKFEQTARLRNNQLPKALLDGDEIMKTLGIKPGKEVGQMIELLREEQLAGRVTTKSVARVLIKKIGKIV